MPALLKRRPWLLAAAGVLIGLSAYAVEGDAQQADARAADGSSAPFTSVERARLRAGELVTREVMRSEGRYHYVGGTSWQVVRAPLTEVWQTVLDTDVYPRLIPSLAQARVVEDGEVHRIVHMTHRYSIASAEYYARVTVDDEAHRVSFDLDRSRPHDLRDGRGFLALSEYRGDTIVTWGALADLGSGMIMQIFGPMLHEWILRVPRCVRDEVEPGRRSYC